MICAKNEMTLKYLQKQFSDRHVQKKYVAVVKGVPSLTHAIIDAPIARDMKTPKMFRVSTDGKFAQTEYTVMKEGKGYTILELQPKTGRTHQLRVHLKYINLPIVGDDLYGGEPFDRLLLHAKSLTIRLPGDDERTFDSPLPDEFEEKLA